MIRVRHTVIAMALLCSQAFAMQWYEYYEEGRKLVDKGNCAKGAPLLAEALQKQPKEDARARPYGVITLEYIPRYYLLKCALESGDLDAAGNYIKDGDLAGQISQSKKSGDYYNLKKRYTDQRKVATTDPPKTDPVKPADPPPVKVDPVPQEDPAAKQRQLELQRKADAQKAVAEAQQALFSNRLDEAKRAAQRALTLDPQNDRARAILSDIREQENAQSEIRRDKQLRLQGIQTALNNEDLARAESLAQQYQQQYPGDSDISRSLAEIKKRKTQPPPPPVDSPLRATERLVLVAYLKGNYEAVIQLVEINEPKFRESWRLPFYQGCAYASLAMLEEKGREERTSQARTAFRKAKQRTGTIPDNPYVSPKILEIFRNS